MYSNKENHTSLNHNQPYYKKSPEYPILLQLIKEIKQNTSTTPITDKLFSFIDILLYCFNQISTSLKPKQNLNLKFLNSIKFKLHENINSFISVCLSLHKVSKKQIALSKGESFSLIKEPKHFETTERVYEELSNENIIEKIKQKIEREYSRHHAYSYGTSRNSCKKNMKLYSDINCKKKVPNRNVYGSKYKPNVRNNLNPFLYKLNTDYNFNHRIILEQDENEDRKSNNRNSRQKKANPFKVCLTEVDYSNPVDFKSYTMQTRDLKRHSNYNMGNGSDSMYYQRRHKLNNSFQSKSFADSLRSSQYTYYDNIGSYSANRYVNPSLPKASNFTNYLMNKYKDVVDRYNYYKDIVNDGGSYYHKMSKSAGRHSMPNGNIFRMNGGFKTY